MAFDQTNTTHHASGPVISTADLIDRLSRYEGPPEQFLINLLNAQCLVASAQGGVIMRADPQGQMEAVAVYPPLPPSAPAPVWVTQSAWAAPSPWVARQSGWASPRMAWESATLYSSACPFLWPSVQAQWWFQAAPPCEPPLTSERAHRQRQVRQQPLQ